ncbi:DUF1918 domain-containing protein [Acrocarpospora sp. B8E8]|uniref:DUF1918 domain-containing protein n=1 Tax=Acrocarpospora sp. B8E8 TaxID=3153572 RepID=UPI00325D30A8
MPGTPARERGSPRSTGLPPLSRWRRSHQIEGSPPYVVRWPDQKHQVLVFPGQDAHIERP